MNNIKTKVLHAKKTLLCVYVTELSCEDGAWVEMV